MAGQLLYRRRIPCYPLLRQEPGVNLYGQVCPAIQTGERAERQRRISCHRIRFFDFDPGKNVRSSEGEGLLDGYGRIGKIIIGIERAIRIREEQFLFCHCTADNLSVFREGYLPECMGTRMAQDSI